MSTVVRRGTQSMSPVITALYKIYSAKRRPGGGNDYDALNSTGDSLHVVHIYVSESDRWGISLENGSNYNMCCNSLIVSADTDGILVNGPQSRVEGNRVFSAGRYGIQFYNLGDDSVGTGNVIHTTGNDGIYIHADAENCVVDGNRITNWTNEAIDDDSGTSIIGDNDTT